MKKHIFLAGTLLLQAAAGSAAVSEGSSGAQFLRIGVGARAAALGDTGAAASGAQSLFYNPAGLASMETSEVFLSQVKWVMDVNYSSLAAAKKFAGGAFGLSVNYLSVPATEKYDRFGNRLGEKYSAADMAAGFGFAANLSDRADFGFAAKFISSQLADKKTSAAAFDAGVKYAARPGRLNLGAALQNAGGGLKYDTETAPLPLNFKVGGEYLLPLDNGSGIKQGLAVLADVNYMRDSGLYGNLGLEFASDSGEEGRYALRGGYRTNSAGGAAGLSAGLGITIGTYDIDYAYAMLGDLGQAHRLSLTLRFGSGS